MLVKDYKLLWNDKFTRPKPEEASQLLFVGITKVYCIANNIDLSREVNLGRGPVDFKFSSGYENRALLEVKRANNGKFFNGLQKQLVKYLQAEGITTISRLHRNFRCYLSVAMNP